jgi:hypothetical protein
MLDWPARNAIWIWSIEMVTNCIILVAQILIKLRFVSRWRAIGEYHRMLNWLLISKFFQCTYYQPHWFSWSCVKNRRSGETAFNLSTSIVPPDTRGPRWMTGGVSDSWNPRFRFHHSTQLFEWSNFGWAGLSNRMGKWKHTKGRG